jgi:hypothetical protein
MTTIYHFVYAAAQVLKDRDAAPEARRFCSSVTGIPQGLYRYTILCHVYEGFAGAYGWNPMLIM